VSRHIFFRLGQTLVKVVRCQSTDRGNFVVNILDKGRFSTNLNLKNLNLTDPKLIVVVAMVILLIAALAWLYVRKRRSTTAGLRQKFGPEYERAILKHGSERKAEAKLADRENRVEKLTIRDLDPMERERFSNQWVAIQSRFVDSPKGAVAEADDVLSSCNENPWLSRVRFRSTCGRHFCRPSPSGRELPVCARDCATGWERRSNYGGSENGDDSLPLSV
jgi:hypothetical protein